MNDSIRRSANRQQDSQRVVDRLAGHDLGWRRTRGRKADRFRAACFRNAQPIGVNGRNRGAARQAHAKRFGEAGHRAGGSHDGARPCGDGEVVLYRGDLGLRNVSRSVARPESPAIGAGAEALAAITARHHRSDDELDSGNACRNRAHQLRGHRLVAAADQHHRTHRLRADHFLHVHRHQIAEYQAGRVEKHLAQ